MVCRGRFLIRDREPTVQNVPHNNGKAGLWGISYTGFYAAAARYWSLVRRTC